LSGNDLKQQIQEIARQIASPEKPTLSLTQPPNRNSQILQRKAQNRSFRETAKAKESQIAHRKTRNIDLGKRFLHRPG
jgi:hypothetical protein